MTNARDQTDQARALIQTRAMHETHHNQGLNRRRLRANTAMTSNPGARCHGRLPPCQLWMDNSTSPTVVATSPSELTARTRLNRQPLTAMEVVSGSDPSSRFSDDSLHRCASHRTTTAIPAELS